MNLLKPGNFFSKKDIFYRLLSDVKKKPKFYRSSKKKLSIFSPEDNSNQGTEVTQSLKKSKNEFTSSNILDTKYVCQPIEKTNTILVYDVIKNVLEQKIIVLRHYNFT